MATRQKVEADRFAACHRGMHEGGFLGTERASSSAAGARLRPSVAPSAEGVHLCRSGCAATSAARAHLHPGDSSASSATAGNTSVQPSKQVESFNNTQQQMQSKMLFPNFDGADPRVWLDKCLNYFQIYNINKCMWVIAAAMHMEGGAERWWQKYRIQHGLCSWKQFVHAVEKQFGQLEYQQTSIEKFSLQAEDVVFRATVESVETEHELVEELHHTKVVENGMLPGCDTYVGLLQQLATGTAYLFDEEIKTVTELSDSGNLLHHYAVVWDDVPANQDIHHGLPQQQQLVVQADLATARRAPEPPPRRPVECRRAEGNCQPNPGCHTLHKMNFPTFSGEDPVIWLDKCFDYFCTYNISKCLWVIAATMHMEGDVRHWWQMYKLQYGICSWSQFVCAVKDKFGTHEGRQARLDTFSVQAEKHMSSASVYSVENTHELVQLKRGGLGEEAPLIGNLGLEVVSSVLLPLSPTTGSAPQVFDEMFKEMPAYQPVKAVLELPVVAEGADISVLDAMPLENVVWDDEFLPDLDLQDDLLCQLAQHEEYIVVGDQKSIVSPECSVKQTQVSDHQILLVVESAYANDNSFEAFSRRGIVNISGFPASVNNKDTSLVAFVSDQWLQFLDSGGFLCGLVAVLEPWPPPPKSDLRGHGGDKQLVIYWMANFFWKQWDPGIHKFTLLNDSVLGRNLSLAVVSGLGDIPPLLQFLQIISLHTSIADQKTQLAYTMWIISASVCLKMGGFHVAIGLTILELISVCHFGVIGGHSGHLFTAHLVTNTILHHVFKLCGIPTQWHVLQHSPKQWHTWLPLVKLGYTSSYGISLLCSPFPVFYGYEPTVFANDKNNDLASPITEHDLRMSVLKQTLLAAQTRMKKQADLTTWEDQEFCELMEIKLLQFLLFAHWLVATMQQVIADHTTDGAISRSIPSVQPTHDSIDLQERWFPWDPGGAWGQAPFRRGGNVTPGNIPFCGPYLPPNTSPWQPKSYTSATTKQGTKQMAGHRRRRRKTEYGFVRPYRPLFLTREERDPASSPSSPDLTPRTRRRRPRGRCTRYYKRRRAGASPTAAGRRRQRGRRSRGISPAGRSAGAGPPGGSARS